MIGLADLLPLCGRCGSDDSLNRDGHCGGCAESVAAEEAKELNLGYRKQAHWWLVGRYIMRTPLHQLVDDRDREQGIQPRPLERVA